VIVRFVDIGRIVDHHCLMFKPLYRPCLRYEEQHYLYNSIDWKPEGKRKVGQPNTIWRKTIGGWFMAWFRVFNATFNNISDISWRSVLLVEETGVPGENH